MPLPSFFFGSARFPQSEEYDEFRYKFLIMVMFLGGLFTALLIAGEYSHVNRINTLHLLSMHMFVAGAWGCWLLLRGHKTRFRAVAWTYEVLCLAEYSSALWFVPADELRILWFFVNVPGVFILLGKRPGWSITVATMAWLVVCNAFMPHPYSGNAMATAMTSMLYLGVFFHVYGDRSISYFVRMRDFNRQLEDMASRDMLTGTLNARAYYQACEQHIQVAHRSGQGYAVLFVDLDHFKRINDTHGHAAGDAVLQAVARCLQSHIRQSDTLGRIGGEEFSIFLPNTSAEGACQLAESLRQAIERLEPECGQGRLRVTASIGVAQNRTPQEPMRAIQHRADAAMYQAKAQGRNRVSRLETNTSMQLDR